MEKQISAVSMKIHQCKNCQESFPNTQIFNCVQCSVMICGSCGLRKHRTHTLNDLLVEEQIKTMMEETRNFFSSEHDYYQNEFKSQCETELRRMFSGISSLQLEIANKLSQMTENDLERAKSEVKRLKGLYGEMRLFYGKYEAQNKMHWDYLQKLHEKLGDSNVKEKAKTLAGNGLMTVPNNTLTMVPKAPSSNDNEPMAVPANVPPKASQRGSPLGKPNVPVVTPRMPVTVPSAAPVMASVNVLPNVYPRGPNAFSKRPDLPDSMTMTLPNGVSMSVPVYVPAPTAVPQNSRSMSMSLPLLGQSGQPTSFPGETMERRNQRKPRPHSRARKHSFNSRFLIFPI